LGGKGKEGKRVICKKINKKKGYWRRWKGVDQRKTSLVAFGERALGLRRRGIAWFKSRNPRKVRGNRFRQDVARHKRKRILSMQRRNSRDSLQKKIREEGEKKMDMCRERNGSRTVDQGPNQGGCWGKTKGGTRALHKGGVE